MNLVAIFNVLRVGTTAADKRSWGTKALATVTLSGLLMALLPFVPAQYAQYINADFVNNFCGTVITVAAAFGVFGTTNIGVLPAKEVQSGSVPDANAQNDLPSGP